MREDVPFRVTKSHFMAPERHLSLEALERERVRRQGIDKLFSTVVPGTVQLLLTSHLL